jgi:hypothetical protein
MTLHYLLKNLQKLTATQVEHELPVVTVNEVQGDREVCAVRAKKATRNDTIIVSYKIITIIALPTDSS